MRSIYLSLCLLVLLVAGFAAGDARGEQGCNDGWAPQTTPTGVQCVQIPGLYRVRPDDGSSPAPPQGHWETRWGAFASSDENLIGLANNLSSEEEAQDEANAHCARKGGTNCRTAMTYYNQCAVVASGAAANGTFGTIYRKHYTIAKATKAAMEYCKEEGLTECKVHFSDCSRPEFVR